MAFILWFVLLSMCRISQAAYVTDSLFHGERFVGGGGAWVTRGIDKIILHPVNIFHREAVGRKWLLTALQGCRMKKSTLPLSHRGLAGGQGRHASL